MTKVRKFSGKARTGKLLSEAKGSAIPAKDLKEIKSLVISMLETVTRIEDEISLIKLELVGFEGSEVSR